MRLFPVLKNIPLDVRLYLQPIAYGLVGGLAAVAFQGAIQLCFRFYWQSLGKVPLPTFAISSFFVVLIASFSGALILKYVSPDAAGSGIPQVKVAFWQNFGFVRLRAAVAKFFAGVLTIGGGVSLGREGPSVSPTLFFGAATGFVLSHLFATGLALNNSDHIALTVAGMSACLGAVVRAPITSILIVFEMTHQFTFVPLLMIGTLVSQGISRAFCKDNFYAEILKRDGIDLDRHMPVRSWASLQRQSIGSLATFSPITVSSQDRSELRATTKTHPYKFFPLVQDGTLQGSVARDEIENDGATPVRILPAQTAPPEATVLEATKLMVDGSAPILILVSPGQRKPIALVTLHDVLRTQTRLAEQF